ncbi:MAG: DUF4465 domain-containing protein [Crocinitomicaceae bacterium]
MKRGLFSLLVLAPTFFGFSQQTIGFEGVNLGSESYYNGSSGTGGVIEKNVLFENDYNTSWSSWSGFSISNTTDVSTAGYLNQYSAFTGAGASGSVNYGVYNSSGSVKFIGRNVELVSLEITNTTYAALSMRDGDQYAKQFGSTTSADGQDDGTNGEDFFKVWIIALDEYENKIDSVEFYLADYRFSDDSQDYIVSSWETVDLSSIQEPVSALTFRFESSDNGTWGMNTPAYFAIDNLMFNENLEVNNLIASNVKVYPNPSTNYLTVEDFTGVVMLLNNAGQIIFSKTIFSSEKINVSEYKNGTYFLKLTNRNNTEIKKISISH